MPTQINWSEIDLTKPFRIPVISTCIGQVSYYPLTESLELFFTDGTAYEYDSVPVTVVLELIQSSSVGRYFNAVIRDNYSFNPL